MTNSGRTVWSLIAAISLAGTLWSLRPVDAVSSGCCEFANSDCAQPSDNSTCIGQGGVFSFGEVCDPGVGCREPLSGCCEGLQFCQSNASELDCVLNQSTFVEDAVCVSQNHNVSRQSFLNGVEVCATFTATATATATDTATATATPTTDLPGGAPCVDPDDCMSGNCVDDVCCDTECDGLLEVCNLEGMEGTCTEAAAAAPAASQRTLTVALGALLLIGIIALVRRRSAV